jgi:hypothetical protein
MGSNPIGLTNRLTAHLGARIIGLLDGGLATGSRAQPVLNF